MTYYIKSVVNYLASFLFSFALFYSMNIIYGHKKSRFAYATSLYFGGICYQQASNKYIFLACTVMSSAYILNTNKPSNNFSIC